MITADACWLMGLDQPHFARLLSKRQLILSHHLTSEWLWSTTESSDTNLVLKHIENFTNFIENKVLRLGWATFSSLFFKENRNFRDWGRMWILMEEGEDGFFYGTYFLHQNMDIRYPYRLDTPSSFSVATYYLICLYCLEHSNSDII